MEDAQNRMASKLRVGECQCGWNRQESLPEPPANGYSVCLSLVNYKHLDIYLCQRHVAALT